MFLGLPGAFFEFRPGKQPDTSPELVVGAMDLLDGPQVFDEVGYGRRRWVFQFPLMSEVDYGRLELLRMGKYGTPPLVLYDPAEVNLFTPNQSLATAPTFSTDGFIPSLGEATSTEVQARTGVRSLLWTMPPAAVNECFLELAWKGDAGLPAIAGQPYSWGVQVAASSTSLSLRADLRWINAAGATISTTTGTASAPLAGSTNYKRYTVSAAAAPAGTHRVGPQLTAATAINNALIYIDELVLARAAAVPDWVPGRGLARVWITGLKKVPLLTGQYSVELRLSETV